MERGPVIVAGFGFRAGALPGSLWAALDLACQDGPMPTHLATAQDKLAALIPLGQALGLPVLGLGRDALRAVQTATHSPRCHAARAVGSLAEASALAAAGPGARLITPRHVSHDRRATCALAKGCLP